MLDAGAKCVYAAATHGLFSADAPRILAEGPFEQIVVTDSVPLRPDAPDNIVQLSLAPLLAESIETSSRTARSATSSKARTSPSEK